MPEKSQRIREHQKEFLKRSCAGKQKRSQEILPKGEKENGILL